MKLTRLGLTVAEVPVVLDWSRREGESKMRVLPTVGGYARRDGPPGGVREGARHDASVGIVGGGLLGLGIAYRARRRAACRSPSTSAAPGSAGWPARPTSAAYDVDRYYHAVTPTDERVLGAGRASSGWRPIAGARSASASSTTGASRSMSTPRELLAFPGLRADDRARLVAFVLRCRRIDGPRGARRPSRSRTWTAPHRAATGCGSACGGRCWTPSSTARYDDLPATYLWSRMRRTAGTRDRRGREVMGWIEGGYQALVDALARARSARAAARCAPATPVELDPGRRRPRRRRRRSTAACSRTSTSSRRILRPQLRAAAGPRARARARARPEPLPRRRLPGRARAPERQPVLRAEHHRPPRAADERRRDDARRGPASPSAATCSTCRATSTRTPRSSSARRATIRAEYLGHVRTMFPAFRPEDVHRRPGRARPRRGAGASGRRGAARSRALPRAGPRGRELRARLPGHRPRAGDPRRRRAGRRGLDRLSTQTATCGRHDATRTQGVPT